MNFKNGIYSVPEGIRYLGDWEDFKLSNFPNYCIIDKELPGCGFTEYCMSSDENVILCSPRKMLLENKWKQHKKTTFLVRNKMDKDPSVDKDISKVVSGNSIKLTDDEKILTEEELEEKNRKNNEIYIEIKNSFKSYLSDCYMNYRPFKILVTYDSYHIIKDILREEGILDNYNNKIYTVIDEFQSILHDARFKSNTEMSFIDHLKDSPTSIFVSATPILKEYIQELEMFKNLPYIELDWFSLDKTRVIKPDLNVLTMRSINSKAEEIIQSYLSNDFETITVLRNGKPEIVVSHEAVLYVNSVNHIINIIKNNNLQPYQVNILCSNTEDNLKKIQNRLGKKFSIGEVPLEGEPNKMFTFCTRTVYLGADFHSDNARTFIFSDSNSDCLAVDISEDLPQILGRQRDEINPWKNSANFYYKTTADYNKMSLEDFMEKIRKKEKETESLLRSFDNALDIDKQTLAKKYQTAVKSTNYKDDYVAVNIVIDEMGNKFFKPDINELVRVNEIRAFRIQQIDYKDRFTVFNKLRSEKITQDDIINRQVTEFFSIYEQKTKAIDKLRLLCENDYQKEVIDLILLQLSDSDIIKSYYLALGPQRLYELGYNLSLIKKELGIITFSPEILYEKIYSEFHEGDKLALSAIKDKLTALYVSINYQKTPKAIDIQNYFEVKEISLFDKKDDGSRKRIKAYELLTKRLK